MNKKYKALQENKNIINTIENFNGIPVSKSDKEEIIEAFNEAKLITSRIKRLRGKDVDVFRESVVQLIHPIYIKYSLNYKVLSDLLGISPGSLSGWFKKSELNPLSNQPRHPNHPTKYRCDEAKFKEWSPNMAYWLGFIWADGHIRNEKYRKHLRIVLSYRDKEHLFLLKDFLKSDIPLVESKVELKNGSEYDVISIVINRKKLVDSLVEYNIFPNRSNDGVAFPEVPDKYSWCFIRGYFDGGGAIYRNQCCNFALSGWVLSFSGSKVNMTYLKKIILDETGVDMKMGRNGRSKKNYSITRSGPSIFYVLNKMYLNSDGDFLNRKGDVSKKLVYYFELVKSFGVEIKNRGDGKRFLNTGFVPGNINDKMIESFMENDQGFNFKDMVESDCL